MGKREAVDVVVHSRKRVAIGKKRGEIIVLRGGEKTEVLECISMGRCLCGESRFDMFRNMSSLGSWRGIFDRQK
jgi:hypothetical protein